MDRKHHVKHLARATRIVVKIGSGVLCDDHGQLQPKTLRRLAAEIVTLMGPGRWPVVVSSGAIAVGIANLGLKTRPKTMPGLQAAAAVGQSKLVEAWSRAFAKYDVPVAQVLLTHSDLANRRRFLNARQAMRELATRRALAVINENDTVSFEEIAFGDNDQLAAQVCNLVEADLLIMLSVAGGVMDGDGRPISWARASDPGLDAMVRTARSQFGSGGMASKLGAARAAAARGAAVAIVDGKTPGLIAALLAGEDVGTLLLPDADRLRSRAHWITHTLRPAGSLLVDGGAHKALKTGGKSLLAPGVVAVHGDFNEGDAVDIVTAKGAAFARGLVRYSADQLRRIAGQPSTRIAEILGFSMGDAIIHRDDLVLLVTKDGDFLAGDLA